MSMDFQALFREYLSRFAAEVGDVADGAFVKYQGRLIKRLGFEEFAPAVREYHDLVQRYFDGLERGDTINNIVVKLLRDKAAALVLPPPM
jgi:hypothetical protein